MEPREGCEFVEAVNGFIGFFESLEQVVAGTAGGCEVLGTACGI